MTVYQRCGTRKDAERFEASERTRAKRTVIEMLQHKLLQPCKRVDPDIPDVCVYLLMLNGKVVHIGLSLDRPVRVAAHRTNGRPFDQVFYIATEAHESIALEKTLIRAIKPRQNRHIAPMIERRAVRRRSCGALTPSSRGRLQIWGRVRQHDRAASNPASPPKTQRGGRQVEARKRVEHRQLLVFERVSGAGAG
jgi:hypothetical protein